MDTEKSYCLCGLRYDPNVFMIQCDVCKDWFHSSCTDFQEQTAPEIDKYHCPRCSPHFGPSEYKPFRNYHRHDYWDENAMTKPVQTGTATFIKELRARHFHNEDEIVIHIKGHMLNESYFVQNSFETPLIIGSKEGLEIIVPTDDFTLHDVENYVGGGHQMDVIDVVRQSDLRMNLNDFVEYFYSPNRTKVYNVVSLEFSKTGLSKLVEAPRAARELDWANVVWPKEYALDQLCVQKYCLMSVKDSYTDFHIDFGGTSVWYHVLRGQKIFYLIKPTPANLTLYQQWMTSSNQSETFFGDQVDQCFKCVLKAGQTMMIPTGWIHAVLTPEDSLVFGGNFLHSLNIPMQLQVYDIEKKIKTAIKFLYPFFETIHWFAAQKMLVKIQKINVEGLKCPDTLLTGMKTLLTYLKSWNTDKEFIITSREQIPIGLNVAKLFKDISKEIRQAERYLNTLNPPKPERESKRKRKRPVNKDFVDFPFRKTSLDFGKSENAPVKVIKKTNPVKSTIKVLPEKIKKTTLKATNIAVDSSWPLLPETATAVHRGGTVLKIKLGRTKDIIPIMDMRTESTPVKLAEISPPKSIYDFKDDDSLDESLHLFIDETPPRKLTKKSPDWSAKIKTSDESPSNGIESLLKASALTTKFIVDRNEQGRTSPSTQEAIAGMLSISQTFVQPKKSTKNRKRFAEKNVLEDDELNDVHQDDDYIYPAIENSDEDLYKPKGRTSVDESWSPRARVGPLLPKMNRPSREGTKKQAVEKVLEAAAKRTTGTSADKSKKVNRRKKTKIPKPIIEKPLATTSISMEPGPSQSSPTINSPGPSKSKKGMKTAKQRLGKILKIHKMMH